MTNIRCMNCGGASLQRFLDLGRQPNGNRFPSYSELGSEVFFPFAMAVCTDCWQVQIEEYPSIEFMFANHPYITGINMPVVEHFDRMVKATLQKFPLAPNSLVLDIGANDGTLLGKFRDAGMRVLGVDPGARTGELARENGITVSRTFWNAETGRALSALRLVPDLITATAVFYHVEDIHSFVQGLIEVMDRQTVFLTQCIYLRDIIEKVQFDHFYHEHTMIHALLPLERLLTSHGLRMIDVDFYDVHGGSFALYVGRQDCVHETRPSIAKALDSERSSGLDRLETYRSFAARVEENRGQLVDLLRSLRQQGKSVYALGAPVKGSTLLNYCAIGPDLVQLATEVNRFKIGRFTPGTHIPIIYEESVEQQPDYYLLLSWNFLEFFARKYARFLQAGGKFIVPHPEVRVLGADALEVGAGQRR